MGEETSDVAPAESPSGGGQAPRAGRRGQVRVFGNWCKGCGLCIAFCPRHVFEAGADGRPLVVNPERCTACMWCVEHCPDFAIVVQPIEDDRERRDVA